MEDLVKSSSMVRGILTSQFDLDLLFEYIPIDCEVISISFDKKIKTKNGISPFKTFKSGVCVKMNTGESIKIFSTGSYSISGAGNIDTALKNGRIALEKLLLKIKKIDYTACIKPQIFNGVYTYKSNKILNDKCEFKGVLKNGFITIDQIKCCRYDLDSRLYCEVSHTDKKKKLYNNMLEYVGYIEYRITRKSKSLCLKNTEYIKVQDNVYEIRKGNHILGELHIILNKDSRIEPVTLPDEMQMKIKICDSDTKVSTISFSNNNCNTRVKLKKSSYLDRDAICNCLKDLGIQYTYDPCSYPGIKFKIDETKITIFRTGSILFSSKKDVNIEAFPFIKKLFETDFTKSDIADDNEDLEGDISIWEL